MLLAKLPMVTPLEVRMAISCGSGLSKFTSRCCLEDKTAMIICSNILVMYDLILDGKVELIVSQISCTSDIQNPDQRKVLSGLTVINS